MKHFQMDTDCDEDVTQRDEEEMCSPSGSQHSGEIPHGQLPVSIKEEPTDLSQSHVQLKHETEGNSENGLDDNFYYEDLEEEEENRLIKNESTNQASNEGTELNDSNVGGRVFVNAAHMAGNERANPNLRLEEMVIDTGTGLRRYKCGFCSKMFTRKEKLIFHVRRHTGEKPFLCNICGREFMEKSSLAKHYTKTHGGDRTFKCDVCEEFFTKGELVEHMKTHEKPYTCDVCGKRFTTRETLKIHNREHTGERPHRCEVCEATFKNQANLLIHIQNYHINDEEAMAILRVGTVKNLHECEQCGKRFLHRSRLNMHIMRKHSGERPHQCETCGKRFVELNKLRKHERMVHIGETHYKCKFCEEEFTLKRYLNKHEAICRKQSWRKYEDLNLQNGESTMGEDTRSLPQHDVLVRCRECGFLFSSKEKFIAHASSCVPLDDRDAVMNAENGANGTSQEKPVKNPWKCSMCKDLFSGLDELVKHVNIHMLKFRHGVQNGSKSDQTAQANNGINNGPKGNKGVELNVASEQIELPDFLLQEGESEESQRSNMSKAQRKRVDFVPDPRTKGRPGRPKLQEHEKKPKVKIHYECTVCGKDCGFTKVNLTRHMMKHTGEKPFQCSMCGRGFTEKNTMIKHERTHTGERPYVCAQCGRGFTQRFRLTTHMRTHTGIKEFQCAYCEKAFFENQTLVRHERSHKNERKYKCDVCEKRFNEIRYLENHRKTHTGEKPYECDQCGKRFTAKYTLTTHKKKHHEQDWS